MTRGTRRRTQGSGKSLTNYIVKEKGASLYTLNVYETTCWRTGLIGHVPQRHVELDLRAFVSDRARQFAWRRLLNFATALLQRSLRSRKNRARVIVQKRSHMRQRITRKGQGKCRNYGTSRSITARRFRSCRRDHRHCRDRGLQRFHRETTVHVLQRMRRSRRRSLARRDEKVSWLQNFLAPDAVVMCARAVGRTPS